MSGATLVAIAVSFFLAGIVKGVTGMGLPTFTMAILGTFMSPVGAASLLVIPSFVTNVWQLVSGPSFVGLIVRLRWMLSGIVAGTVAAAGVLTSHNAKWTTVGLGAALVVSGTVSLLARPWSCPPNVQRWLAPVVGLMTGLTTGATGVFVIPAVPYLQSLGLAKDELVQALGLSFTVATLALGFMLSRAGTLHLTNIAISSLATVPALLGMWFGTTLRKRISPASFRRWFQVCLVLLGLELMIRSLL